MPAGKRRQGTLLPGRRAAPATPVVTIALCLRRSTSSKLARHNRAPATSAAEAGTQSRCTKQDIQRRLGVPLSLRWRRRELLHVPNSLASSLALRTEEGDDLGEPDIFSAIEECVRRNHLKLGRTLELPIWKAQRARCLFERYVFFSRAFHDRPQLLRHRKPRDIVVDPPAPIYTQRLAATKVATAGEKHLAR